MDDRILTRSVPSTEDLMMMPATAASGEKPAADAALSVEVVSDYGSFLKLERLWNGLVEKAAIDHPFVRHEWVRTWWESFGTGKNLHILLVKRGGEAIGIAPLVLDFNRIYGLKVRRLRAMRNDHSPRFDFIVTGSPECVYGAIWKYVADHTELWDVLEICPLLVGSRTFEQLYRSAVTHGLPVGTWPSENSPYIDLTKGWDAYLAGVNARHAKKTRQRIRQLEQIGAVNLEIVSFGQSLDAALEDGFRLEAAGWKSESGTAIRCSRELVQFYTRLASTASQAGMLRLIFLTVAGIRIAFAYALYYKNKLFVLKAGYDPEYGNYSPYNVLCYLLFRDACEHGVDEYEFLGSNEPWKLRWTKTTKPHCWLFVFSTAPRARLVHWIKFQVAPKLKHCWLALS